jgi:DNA invertase Pin-like site-specific DNA recombinase
MGWEVVAEFQDQKSRKSLDRPGFKKMMAFASKREFDVPVFWDLSRLSCGGEVVISLLASIAKLEREKIRERTLACLPRARKAERSGVRPRAEDDPKLVKKVQSLRVEGRSVRAIVSELGVSPTAIIRLAKNCLSS